MNGWKKMKIKIIHPYEEDGRWGKAKRFFTEMKGFETLWDEEEELKILED